MPNLSDTRELRNKALADAQALTLAGDLTAETRTKFDALIAEADAHGEDIKRLERSEQIASEQRSRQANRPNPDATEDRAQQVKASFRSYLRTGQIESRDLTVANQGILIPQLFDPTIISAKKSYGEVYDLVNIMKTDHGEPIKMVLDNDTANGLVSLTVGTDAAEVDPPTSSIMSQVGNYTTGLIKVDNGLLGDAGFDVEEWIRTKFAARFFRGASSLIVNGDNANVASLTAGYAASGFTSAVTNKLGYADFVAAIAALDPAYQADAVFAMSNATLGAVLSIVDGNQRPIFLADYGSGSQGFVGRILGYPVKLVTQLPPVATGNTPVLFGSFKEGYTFRQQGQGLGILRLNERYAAGYETGFVGFARVGGVVTDAGTHPILGITIK